MRLGSKNRAWEHKLDVISLKHVTVQHATAASASQGPACAGKHYVYLPEFLSNAVLLPNHQQYLRDLLAIGLKSELYRIHKLHYRIR
jgi:hypothetical protein